MRLLLHIQHFINNVYIDSSWGMKIEGLSEVILTCSLLYKQHIVEFFTRSVLCYSVRHSRAGPDLSDCKLPAPTVLMNNVNAVGSLVKKQLSQNDLNIVRFGHWRASRYSLCCCLKMRISLSAHTENRYLCECSSNHTFPHPPNHTKPQTSEYAHCTHTHTRSIHMKSNWGVWLVFGALKQ